jgi:hypothetical protein
MRIDDDTYLTLDSGYLKFTVSSTDVSFGLGLGATLHLAEVGGASKESTVKFVGEITISTTQILVSLQVGTCGSNQTGWPNAFGIDGLTVECAAIQGGVSYAGVPTFGLVGKVTALPPDLARTIGYQQGAPMQFAFNFDPFMLSMSIGIEGSQDVALRPFEWFGQETGLVDPDLVEIRYASLYVAPVPVTIGQTKFPAGYGLGFQAKVAGVDIDVIANVDPNKPSLSVKATVSEIKLGALSIGPVDVDLLASKTDFHFKLKATMKLGPESVDIGPALRIGGELSASVEVSLAKTGLEAYFWGYAKVELAANLPHETCFYSGFLPYPCDFYWESTDFELNLGRTGFSVTSKGLTLSAGGQSITLPWKGGGGGSTNSAASQALSEPVTAAGPPPGIGATASGSSTSGSSASVDLAAEEDEDSLAVATPEASDEPMAAAPLPGDLILPEGAVVGEEPWVIAPPSAPMPDVDEPVGDPTVVVIDPDPVPASGDELAPGSWTSTGALADARAAAAIALLPDGDVLRVGGAAAGPDETDSEIYDPATRDR